MGSRIPVEKLFRQAVEAGCSDIHIKPGSPPKMRLNGKLIPVTNYEHFVLTVDDTKYMTEETMDDSAFSNYNTNGINQIDYGYELEGVGRFRMNAYKARGHNEFVARLLAEEPQSLSELGVHPKVEELIKHKSGLVIVSGATGSGKSTTMNGMIKIINETMEVHVISIEDPIEVIHNDKKASISQREVGGDVDSFDDALTAAMRQDPDVILIGEIRTALTLKTALQAADTGHLVIATLHTTDSTKTINRIMALSPPEERDLIRQQLAATLKGVVAQRLLPSKNGGKRVVINEILINTAEATNLVLEDAPETKFREMLENSPKMVSFEQNFVNLIKEDKITIETAYNNSDYPDYFDAINLKEAVETGNANSLPTSVPIAKLPQRKVLPVAGPGLPAELPKLPALKNPQIVRTKETQNSPVFKRHGVSPKDLLN